MPNNYIAPYLISDDPAQTYEGMFTVPICTTRERFDKIMNALWAYGAMQGEEADFDHLVDWLDALPRITEGCVDFTNQCRTIALNSPQVEWFPESPYSPGEEVPDGYEFHPWTIASNDTLPDIIIAWGLGYKYGDVFTDLTKFPDITDPENFFDEYQNLPRFRVSGLVGAGTIKVEILSIPFGGRVVVLIDEFVDLLNLQAADTDADASFPPESIISTTITTEVTGDGPHTVDYVFYPTVETELPILGAGGGVRSIELCGFGVTDMAVDGCCDETNLLLKSNNQLLQQIYQLWKGGLKLVPINDGEPPDTITIGECAPTKYDEDEDDTGDEIPLRLAALCYVIEAYVVTVLVKAVMQMGLPLSITAVLYPLYLTAPSALQRVKVEYPAILSMGALLEGVLASGVTTDLVVCQMLARLRGQFNTFSAFKDSLDIFGGVGTFTLPLTGLVNATNQNKENWLAFGDALEQAMGMPDAIAGYTCPCSMDCTEPLELTIKDGRGTLVKVEGTTDLYHFTGASTIPVDEGLHGGVYVRDAFGRCLTVWMATDGETGVPPGWADQGVLYHHVKGCCGTSDSTGLLGGFAGVLEGDQKYTEFYWDRQDQAVDTYYHVKCFEC